MVEILEYDNEHQVRYLEWEGEKFFCVKDIIVILGYDRKAASQTLGYAELQDRSQIFYNALYLSESDVHELLRFTLHSKPKATLNFQQWFYVQLAKMHECQVRTADDPHSEAATYQIVISGLTGKVFEFYTAMLSNVAINVPLKNVVKFFNFFDGDNSSVKFFLHKEIKQ